MHDVKYPFYLERDISARVLDIESLVDIENQSQAHDEHSQASAWKVAQDME